MTRAALESLAHSRADQVAAVGDEDAVHDGFVTLLARGIEGIERPGAYWYVVSRRAAADRARRRGAEARALVRYARDRTLAAAEETATAGCGVAVSAEALRAAVDGLRPRQRKLVELELCGVVDAQELAQCLGTTPGNVRVLRHRAHRRLRSTLLGDGEGAAA